MRFAYLNLRDRCLALVELASGGVIGTRDAQSGGLCRLKVSDLALTVLVFGFVMKTERKVPRMKLTTAITSTCVGGFTRAGAKEELRGFLLLPKHENRRCCCLEQEGTRKVEYGDRS